MNNTGGVALGSEQHGRSGTGEVNKMEEMALVIKQESWKCRIICSLFLAVRV